MTGVKSILQAHAMMFVYVVAGVLLSAAASSDTHSELAFRDPLDYPAELRTAPAGRPLMSVARAGDRLVAVGPRGLIIVSADEGKTWSQAKVPVQSDLLAVQFPTAQQGWAVGHDGVILHSEDGGKTWVKQLDGRMAGDAFKDYYRKRVEAGDAFVQDALKLIEQNFKAGPALPYLDVWFEDTRKGFAVGSFGMIAVTVDGGKTWEPWLHRIDNHQSLNLNSIRGIDGGIYIAAEQGTVFRLDRAKEHFLKADTGYAGSFFGLVGDAESVVVFGLLGTAFRSVDRGVTWTALSIPAKATITAGTGPIGSSRFVLVNDAGQMLVSDAGGQGFHTVRPRKPMFFTGVVAVADHSAIMTGLDGVASEVLSGFSVESRNFSSPDHER